MPCACLKGTDSHCFALSVLCCCGVRLGTLKVLLPEQRGQTELQGADEDPSLSAWLFLPRVELVMLNTDSTLKMTY